MSTGVIVIAEASSAGLTAAGAKTISFARRLADAVGEELRIVIPGRFPEASPIAGAGPRAATVRGGTAPAAADGKGVEGKDEPVPVSGNSPAPDCIAGGNIAFAADTNVGRAPNGKKTTADKQAEGASTSLPSGQMRAGGKPDNNASNIFALMEQTGGAEMIFLSGDTLATYSAEAWKESLAPLCRKISPRFLCIPHTSRGWDYGPGLAIRLEAALIGAVEDFRREEEDGVFLFRRSILKGQWRQEVRPETWPVVLTVLPEAATSTGDDVAHSDTAPGMKVTALIGSPATAPDDTKAQAHAAGDTPEEPGSDIRVSNLSFSSPRYADVCTPPSTPFSLSPSHIAFCAAPTVTNPRCLPLGKLPAGEVVYDFSTAEVIVAAGQGIGGEENIALLRRLAALFPKAALGCSRAVCDRGWMEYRRQIGLTGRTVTPPLYIACGISGAMPHLAGMRDSGCIVAVNRDQNAAIFQVAHIGIVADLLTFLPAVLEQANGSEPEAEDG